jgi:riboflavin synthase
MFTGIIHEMGTVVRFDPTSGGAKLEIRRIDGADPLTRGESIAVNGVCLTALPLDAGFAADLSGETLKLTTLGRLHEGARVNLERAMAMGDRLGGHLVQGHVDATGAITDIRHEGEFAVYRWSYPSEFAPLVVSKGSIAVDGISLTIVEPDDTSFGVALIPETLQQTNLGASKIGDLSNLEFDVMAKYAQNLFLRYLPARES